MTLEHFRPVVHHLIELANAVRMMVIERHERARQLGELVGARLKKLQQQLSCIGDVRGLGAMLAMELVKNRDPHAPDADLAKALVQLAARNGLILLSCGVYGNVIRFLMPLTASDAIVSEGLDILERSLRELVG